MMDRLREANEWAKTHGFKSAEELALKSGEVVYLMQSDGNIGLPRYARYLGGGDFEASTDEESMALFEEPDYLREVD